MRLSSLALASVAVLSLAACQPSGPGSSTSSLASSVEGWQTVSVADAYAYQVPAAWKGEVSLAPDGQHISRYAGTKGETVQTYDMDAQGAVNVGEYLQKLDATRATGYEGQPSTEIRETKRVSVDGEPGAERREYGLASGFEMEVTYVLKDGRIYVVSTWHEGNETLTADDVAMHQQIAKTLAVK
jgi:hypothetical protein